MPDHSAGDSVILTYYMRRGNTVLLFIYRVNLYALLTADSQ